MTNNIVTVNVSQTQAPIPSILQATGAIVSQGGTSLAAGAYSLLTQPADLTSLLTGAKTLASLAWASSVVTATSTTPHGFPSGEAIELTITGAVPAGYNGTFLATVTGTSTFTYPLASNPGTNTAPGSYTPDDVAELTSQVGTFFAQGNTQAVYVLELGPHNSEDAIAALDAWIIANSEPQIFYSYLVPREWSDETTFPAMLARYTALTKKTYFFVTMTVSNYTNYSNLLKCVIGLVESPTKPTSEFSLASIFYVTLNYEPSPTNMVTPLAFAIVAGVTAYPIKGNGPLFTSLKTAGVNRIGTGAEGGITNTIVFWGTTMDGRPFNYWYSVDWVQIEEDLDLSNEIINGSNNPLAPLYYNQDGINRLQARAQQTMNRGITFGLVLGPVTVDAIPFTTYVAINESDYRTGTYNGLSVTYTPSRGFEQITFNVNVTDFPAA